MAMATANTAAISGKDLAEQHARKASDLLWAVEETEDRLAHMSQDEQLQATASGTFQQMNRNITHSLALAQAHAQTAVACAWIEDTEQ